MQASIGLSAAMNLGRIMIFENPDDHPYLQDDYCKGLPAMDACYLLPISKCAAGVAPCSPVSGQQTAALRLDAPTQPFWQCAITNCNICS